MKLLDQILVPVDLGPNTEGVIDTATHLAKAFHAKLQLLYVIEEVPHFPVALELVTEGVRERMSKLNDVLQSRGVRCDPPVQEVGRPFDVIVRMADRVNAHLILMGRGGCREGSPPNLGTTTSRVMRRTSKPVIIVAPGANAEMRRILCPVDGSNASARGLRNAILMTRCLKARLTVLTVIADFSWPLGMAHRVPDMAKIASEYEKMEREQFEQFIKGFDLRDVTWDKEVHYGHPAEQIVRLASEAKYDLVIMGSTGRSGLPRILLGSTAESVTRRVPCAVLTVKRENVLSVRLDAEVADLNRLLAEGRELLEQGFNDEAILRFDQCLLKDPYLAPAVEGQAIAHERLGHDDRAADLREQAALIRQELWRQQTAEEPALH